MNLRKRIVNTSAAAVVLLASMIGSSGPSDAARPTSLLTVTMNWAPELLESWTLQCDPVGGTHPNRFRACALLDSLAAPFAVSPTGMACTMIYSGPERARVVGQWQGEPVAATFTRADGCATARWRTYQALLTDPGMLTVRGRVDLAPTCPVQRPGENCQIVGASAIVSAISGSRHRTVRSGADGFTLRLTRALWTFTADAGMSCPSVIADARIGHKPRLVVISCDTGIRMAG
ncbi:MAG: SSI family serine proteinase inhibitor [Actinomycetota bacterium]|nr:SSI family serine proteinase inhibitor [Actinomycetota bacterium]